MHREASSTGKGSQRQSLVSRQAIKALKDQQQDPKILKGNACTKSPSAIRPPLLQVQDTMYSCNKTYTRDPSLLQADDERVQVKALEGRQGRTREQAAHTAAPSGDWDPPQFLVG